jgi:phenylacetate-CoA ligase
VAVECPARQGLHVFEDCYVVQVVDPETGERLPDGEVGALVVTELYKTGSPQFRYNILDLSFLYPREQCACGSWLRRMGPFAGRGDNMVKLRGINVWPEAVGELAIAHARVGSDYFVRAIRAGNRDELVVSVVSEAPAEAFAGIASEIEAVLKSRLGVRILVEVVAPGALDAWTGVDRLPKLKRFRDDRA